MHVDGHFFEDLLSICREVSINQAFRRSIHTQKYVSEAISNGLYPHEYLFYHVREEYLQSHPLGEESVGIV